ncbi:hypothetical protein GLOIN_2v1571918 [Rhizophagus clarus]|uniref:Uncharacterized protein n=1 Tax=Rhizophagus clarus TaxID=94130 RepID=A0A8H3QJD2_9GLOM|nr:hypothetical protein GLOIN_2v1571918 [Rhizophagus clarus]
MRYIEAEFKKEDDVEVHLWIYKLGYSTIHDKENKKEEDHEPDENNKRKKNREDTLYRTKFGAKEKIKNKNSVNVYSVSAKRDKVLRILRESSSHVKRNTMYCSSLTPNFASSLMNEKNRNAEYHATTNKKKYLFWNKIVEKINDRRRKNIEKELGIREIWLGRSYMRSSQRISGKKQNHHSNKYIMRMLGNQTERVHHLTHQSLDLK